MAQEQDELPYERPKGGDWGVAIAASALMTALVFLPAALYLFDWVPYYGWWLFALAPGVVGFFAATFINYRAPRKLTYSFGATAATLGLIAAGLLFFAVEGLICIVMAAPIILFFGFIGCLIGHEIQKSRWARKHRPPMLVTIFALLPVAFVVEVRAASAPAYRVTTDSIVIDATPAQIWPYLLNLPKLPDPEEPLFRWGVAHPVDVRTEGNGVGARRVCALSTGDMDEVIETFRPGRELQFRVLNTPASMRELNPFGEVRAPHLHGYYECLRGRFLLTPLPGGRTRLTGTSWYRYRIFPSGYWGFWTDKIVRDVHLRVMLEIKHRAEAS